MKYSGLILLISGLLAVTNSCSQESKELGTYVGATPCIQGAQPLQGIPKDSDCEFIKWELTLYVNERNEPVKYKLGYTYGISQPNTQGFKDGKKIEIQGEWKMAKGSKTNPAATIYQLDYGVSLVKLSDGILHLLDNEKRLMVGTPGYSFTLNKISK